MNEPDAGQPLRFETIAGPPLEPIAVAPGAPAVFGRSTAASVQFPDKTVSRSHCTVEHRARQWFLTDLNSRHGTFLNGVRLESGQPAPLAGNDALQIGPWTLRVRDGSTRESSRPTTDDAASVAHKVQRVPQRELRSVAQHRLDLLIACAAGINAAADLPSLAAQALAAITDGTGFSRAAYIRPVSAGGDVEVVAYRGPETGDEPTEEPGPGPAGTASRPTPRASEPPDDFAFSRSLIQAASEGEIVRMTGDAGPAYGESIIRLGIHSALCVPINLGESVEAFLYLDARGGESAVQQDAAAFCQAVSRMAGLALANLKRLQLETQRRTLENELRSAREAQRLIMPPAHGRIGPLAYALFTRPGQQVAGDLLDVVPLPREEGTLATGAAREEADWTQADRAAIFLGDVTGKGAAAGIVMAVAQTHLAVTLRELAASAPADARIDLAHAIDRLNRYICDLTEPGMFLSLFVAVADTARRELTFVDAGHSYAVINDPGEAPRKAGGEGCVLIGIEPEARYTANTVPFTPGSALSLFSDGLIEQTGPTGDQFGVERALGTLAGVRATDDADPIAAARRDVRALTDALFDHAGAVQIGDDLTVASMRFPPMHE